MPVQTTYNTKPSIGCPGMLLDDAVDGSYIVSYPAGEDMPAGVLCEITNGLAYLPKSSALGKVGGITLYQSTLAPLAWPGNVGGYKAGDMVPVLRKGRVFASFQGGTQTELTAVGVQHASTNGSGNAQYRGFFTATAANATAGTEIDALTHTFFITPVAQAGLCVVAISLP